MMLKPAFHRWRFRVGLSEENRPMTDTEPDRLFATFKTPLRAAFASPYYWNIITQIKHPIMNGQESARLQATLAT
jgi:hypothetical protein